MTVSPMRVSLSTCGGARRSTSEIEMMSVFTVSNELDSIDQNVENVWVRRVAS